MIGEVDKDGPAATAGLQRGDTIVRVNGVPVESISDVLAVVSTFSPGQTVALQFRRAHHQRILSVMLGSRTVPTPDADRQSRRAPRSYDGGMDQPVPKIKFCGITDPGRRRGRRSPPAPGRSG